MAAERPIVASRLGQIGDVLEHRRTGWLVEPDRLDELAEAIEILALDSSLRNQLGSAARAAAIEHHGWERNARGIIDAYREVRETGR
jgi:glycosyltransferase involved in cell wall biosynthesis